MSARTSEYTWLAAERSTPAELLQDLVPLRDVALVELVVGLDGLPGDAVELEELRLELAGSDLLELVGKRRQILLPSWTKKRPREHNEAPPAGCFGGDTS